MRMNLHFVPLLGALLLLHVEAQQPRIIFDCATQEQTDGCNANISSIYYSVCLEEPANVDCNMCIMGCQHSFESGTNDSSVDCANKGCVSDVCTSYSLFTNNSYGFSCGEVYTDQYCTYCKTCYVPPVTSSSNFTCDDYTSIFCRLMPEQLNPNCYAMFGVTACDQCVDRLQGLNCSQLMFNNLTQEQNQTLCSIAGSCSSLPPAFNCTAEQELDCRLCNYLMDRSACDFTPTEAPAPEMCIGTLGVFCGIVNSLDPCDAKYSTETCQTCSEYSLCPPVNIQQVTAQQRFALCNSTNATLCGNTVSLDPDTCYDSSNSFDCDYCQASLPVCNYENNQEGGGGSGADFSCGSSAVQQCGYDVFYFPCAILNGIQYCSECNQALETCGDPDFGSGFVPPNLCDNDVYISLCYQIINLPDCDLVVSEESCSFCEDVVNTTCTLPADIDMGLDRLCSSEYLSICQQLLSDNENCTDIDCQVCSARDTLCDGFVPSDLSSDYCNSSAGILFCRIYGSNLTSCLSNFSLALCSGCSDVLYSCSAIALDDLTNEQRDTICGNFSTCDPFFSSPSLCDYNEYTTFCDQCNGFQSICRSTGSGLPPVCTGEEGYSCRIDYYYYPCYVSADEATCDYCGAVVELCPNLEYHPDYLPPEICEDDVYVSSCSVIANEDNIVCEMVYGADACQYCELVFSQCSRQSTNEIANTLDDACSSAFQPCRVLLDSTTPEECVETYTRIDCAYCTLLSSYCPSVNNGGGINCSMENNFFCSYAYNQDDCDSSFLASTCRDCDNYTDDCLNKETIDTNDTREFCLLTSSLYTCGNLPLGPGCRYLLPAESYLCDFCNFYVEQCEDEICSDSELNIGCSALYNDGEELNLESNNANSQCLPCSLFSSICNASNITGFGSVSISPSLSRTDFFSFTSFMFVSSTPSSFIFSSDVFPSSSVIFPSSSPLILSSSGVFPSSSPLFPSSSSIFPSSSSGSSMRTRVIASTLQPRTTISSSSTPAAITSLPAATTTTTTTTSTGQTTTTTRQATTTTTTSTGQTTTTTTTRQATTTTTSTTRRTTATTTTSTRTTRSSTESTTATPTRTSVPPEDAVSVDDLTGDQIRNAVTMEFEGLTRTTFLENLERFIAEMETLLNSATEGNKRRRQSNGVQIKIITESIEEQSNGNLQFSMVAEQQDGEAVSGDTVRTVVQDNGDTLAQSIGASGLSNVETGLPPGLAPTDAVTKSGLSSGAIAGIIILVLVVLIVILVVVAIVVYIYAVKNKKGKYIVTATDDIMNPADIKSRDINGQELTLSQSMKEKEGVSASTVVKNQEAVPLEEDKIDETKEEESRIDGETKEEEKEKKGDDSSNSSGSSDDESEKEKKGDDSSNSSGSSDNESEKEKKKPKQDNEDDQNTHF